MFFLVQKIVEQRQFDHIFWWKMGSDFEVCALLKIFAQLKKKQLIKCTEYMFSKMIFFLFPRNKCHWINCKCSCTIFIVPSIFSKKTIFCWHEITFYCDSHAASHKWRDYKQCATFWHTPFMRRKICRHLVLCVYKLT